MAKLMYHYYNIGWDDYEEGQVREHCPYLVGSDEEFSWLWGWDAAQEMDIATYEEVE